MFVNRGVDKDDVIHTYNGILLNHKKELFFKERNMVVVLFQPG